MNNLNHDQIWGPSIHQIDKKEKQEMFLSDGFSIKIQQSWISAICKSLWKVTNWTLKISKIF